MTPPGAPKRRTLLRPAAPGRRRRLGAGLALRAPVGDALLAALTAACGTDSTAPSPLEATSSLIAAVEYVGTRAALFIDRSATSRTRLLFTGATASLRGSANFAPFAIAKFGLRALAQSMARELGPKGIHVAHMVIDGQIGDAVATFTLPRVDGGELTVDATGAPATVVVFTANHCPYALAWHERIQQVARDYAAQGVTLVQINPNNAASHPADSTEASAKRVAAGEFAGPYLRDEPQAPTRAWGAEKTPDIFLVDRSGTLAYRGAPDADYDDESQRASYLRNALDDVLAARPVALPETPPRGCTIKWR